MGDKTVDINPGCGTMLLAGGVVMLFVAAFADITARMDDIHNSQSELVRIERARLELQSKQYALDSLQYENSARGR